MVNVYWKGGTGGTKSDISTQANWVDSAGTQISNTVWNSGDLSAHNIILDRTKNISPSDPVPIILDGSPSTVTFNSLYIKYSDNSKWHNMLQFGNSQTTLVLSGLDIRQSEMISATAATIIKFTGIPHHNSSAVSAGTTTGTVSGGNAGADLYIKIVDEDDKINRFVTRSLAYDNSVLALANQYKTAGMFVNTASRGYITFLFEPPNNTVLVLDNGIYPKMDFDCASTNTATLCFDEVFTGFHKKSNSFTKVDMLNLNIDSSFKVKPRQHLLRNRNKHIKLSGGYTLNCTVFDMGYATLEIIPTVNNVPISSGYIPSSDTHLFGITPTSTQRRGMKVKYTKLIIGSPVNDSYKLLIADNNIITCEELVIKAGGRLYGTNYGDDNTAEIHCLKQPIIEGDWNFTEISRGIYRAAGTTPTLPVTMGGTGLNEIGLQGQVLAVKSNGRGLEWRADIDTNTTYSAYGGSAAGLVPTRDTGGTTTKYLREDGDWVVPPSGGGGSGTVTPSSADTFTNKTLDANATGNLITNIDIGNMTDAVIQLSSESFTDNDTSLMTSAAIQDKITTQVATILAANISPLPYERRSLGTSVGKIGVAGNDSSAVAFGYPMPLAGKVKRVSFLFQGGDITDSNNNVFRVIKNTDTSGNYVEVNVPSDALVNKGANGEYHFTFSVDLGVNAMAFNAGDLLWITRHSGNTDLNHCQAVVWIGI